LIDPVTDPDMMIEGLQLLLDLARETMSNTAVTFEHIRSMVFNRPLMVDSDRAHQPVSPNRIIFQQVQIGGFALSVSAPMRGWTTDIPR
jgi:hypothetical protein